jgi:hypothetical protein
MRRRIEQIAAELAAMPESEWTTWIMPYPSELGRAPGNANMPRGTISYIGEAVRRAESRLLLPGYGSIDFSLSNTLSEVVVRGERWMVALAAVALNEEINHVWNRFLVVEAERTALEFQERENKASESRAGLVRLDWPGGTLGEFVKAVQAAVPRQPVNVVLHERDGATGSVSSVHIGPISVRDVTPTALFRSLGCGRRCGARRPRRGPRCRRADHHHSGAPGGGCCGSRCEGGPAVRRGHRPEPVPRLGRERHRERSGEGTS